MASIQKRLLKNGETAFRVQVRLKGYQVQRATFDRLTDARRWAQSTEAALRERRYFRSADSRKHTVDDLVERYKGKLERENPKRLHDVDHLLKWWQNELGHCVLADLTASLISEKLEGLSSKQAERWNEGVNKIERKFISPATVNRYSGAFSHVCTLAVNEWEWLESNPLGKIKKLKEPRGRVRFLDDAERNSLLAACEVASYRPLYLIVVLALSTGARRSEILNLKWTDVDLNRKRIVLHETKNGERRVIPLTGHVFDLMKDYNSLRHIGSQFVFPSIAGDKPYEIKKSWEAAIRRAGIQDFRFHDLRHSAASYLAMNGASVAEIAEVLGHKTLQMVKRYAHLSESHTTSVVQRMNERIFDGRGR